MIRGSLIVGEDALVVAVTSRVGFMDIGRMRIMFTFDHGANPHRMLGALVKIIVANVI